MSALDNCSLALNQNTNWLVGGRWFEFKGFHWKYKEVLTNWIAKLLTQSLQKTKHKKVVQKWWLDEKIQKERCNMTFKNKNKNERYIFQPKKKKKNF